METEATVARIGGKTFFHHFSQAFLMYSSTRFNKTRHVFTKPL